MLVISITFCIEDSVAEHWLEEVKTRHIPSLLLSGLISEYKLMKLLMEMENNGTTYNCQFVLTDENTLSEFESIHIPQFLADIDKQFARMYGSFRTILQVID